eukprot:g37803.t1
MGKMLRAITFVAKNLNEEQKCDQAGQAHRHQRPEAHQHVPDACTTYRRVADAAPKGTSAANWGAKAK